MARVAVVTDSTASLPAAAAVGHTLKQVPLQVIIDGQSRSESGDPQLSRDVADALRSGVRVTTSKPSPETFADTYRRLLDDDVDDVVSVHLSAAISGTYDAAVQAAASFGGRVHVIDSQTIAMGCGFAAMAGAQLAHEIRIGSVSKTGGQNESDDVEMITKMIHDRARRSEIYFSVASLEYLRRGGRIGAAAATLGSSLAIKPLLRVAGGIIVSTERVRTTARAHNRLAELAGDAVHRADGAADVAVHHVDDARDAGQLADRLDAVIRPGQVVVSEVSAVLGVHVGPGTVGVVISPRSS